MFISDVFLKLTGSVRSIHCSIFDKERNIEGLRDTGKIGGDGAERSNEEDQGNTVKESNDTA